MLKKFKVISKIVEWVAFVFLLGILVVVLSPYLPLKNIPKTFVVVTGSMEPTIKTGSVVFVKTVDPKNIKKGDIIAFTSPSNSKDTILHRVDSISSTNPLTFKTKGDNNNDIDAWDVMDVGVKGLYFGAIPYLGYIGAFVKKPLGFGLIIGLPAFLFIISQLFNIKKAINEEVNRKVAKKIAESKKSNSTKTILKSIIFFILFISTLFAISGIHIIKAAFSDTVTISGINISIADFTKPTIPTNLHWNNPDVSCNGSTNSRTITADWDNSTDNTTITKYEYEIIYPTSIGGTGIWHTFVTSSLYNGVFNQAEGVHSYRIRAYDNDGNISDWSNSCSITYDKTLPTSTITSPIISQNHELTFTATTTPTISDWNGKIEGTAFDSLSGIDHVNLSIYSSSLNQYWNGSAWVDGNETIQVKAIGDTNWSHQIATASLFNGIFKIVSHAVDKAGNIENSATIIFEYVAPIEIIVPTITPIPTDIPTPFPTDIPTPFPTDILTPTPTDIPTPFPTDIPIPTPTETSLPTPTETPVPTETPASVEPVSIIII